MDDRSIQELLDLFGLAPDFNINQLSRAYRDLVQVWHPDRFQNNARLKQMAEEKTKEINAAYSILKRWHHRKGERRKEESESPKEKHYRDEEFSNEETAQETEFKSNSY